MDLTSGLVLDEKPSFGVEPTRLYDQSRYGNHGTHSNITMVQLPSGLWVRDLNGSSSIVTVSSNTSLETATAHILMWHKPETNPATCDLISHWTAGTGGWSVSGVASVAYAFSGGEANDFANRAGALTIGKWTMIEARFDSSIVAGQIGIGVGYNAIYSGLTQRVSSMGVSGADLIIGRGGRYNGLYDGMIALPKVYNRIVPLAEIRAIYNREKGWFGL